MRNRLWTNNHRELRLPEGLRFRQKGALLEGASPRSAMKMQNLWKPIKRPISRRSLKGVCVSTVSNEALSPVWLGWTKARTRLIWPVLSWNRCVPLVEKAPWRKVRTIRNGFRFFLVKRILCRVPTSNDSSWSARDRPGGVATESVTHPLAGTTRGGLRSGRVPNWPRPLFAQISCTVEFGLYGQRFGQMASRI